MPYSEKQRETLGWVLRLHWFLAVGLLVVFFLTEGLEGKPQVSSYDIILWAALFLLIIWLFFLARRGERFLAPLVFMMDGVAIAVGVAISGGPVSYYQPLFLVSLLGACLVCSLRATWVVIAEHALLYIAAIAFAYRPFWPGYMPDHQFDDMAFYLAGFPPEVRDRVFFEQAVRWGFLGVFFVLMALSLVRRIWAREEALRTRERVMEQKRRLIQMGEMTGRIAHGVNTPLGLLSGNLEMLLSETRKGTKLHKRLVELDGYVQRAIGTVRQTLDYNREPMSQIRRVNLPDLLATVAETAQPKLKKRGVDLILNVEADLPTLMGYQEGLFQAFLNVVENAVDALPEGEIGVVTLTAAFRYRKMRLSAADTRGEVVGVGRDTGRGIPPEELGRIFEPFYSTKDFGRGTGLGLSIVKRIVEEHQGTLQIESRVGSGTTITIAFPSEKPVAQAEKAPAPEAKSRPEGL